MWRFVFDFGRVKIKLFYISRWRWRVLQGLCNRGSSSRGFWGRRVGVWWGGSTYSNYSI